MKPGPPALCPGVVWHRRHRPSTHAFRYDVTYAWFDPDRPESITDRHWAWSTGRFRPARIRTTDYGWPEPGSTAERVRRLLRGVEPDLVAGDVRLLTQPRRWGWLFNPISLYLVWTPDIADRPTGAVLEVTNTPWKERLHYAVALEPEEPGDESGGIAVGATFAKDLHVSPFLPMDMTYHLRISQASASGRQSREPVGTTFTTEIAVSDPDGHLVLTTGMRLECRPATREVLAESLRHDGFPTHRVSGGIHRQAARLLTKGVAFVPHPKRSTRHGLTRH